MRLTKKAHSLIVFIKKIYNSKLFSISNPKYFTKIAIVRLKLLKYNSSNTQYKYYKHVIYVAW